MSHQIFDIAELDVGTCAEKGAEFELRHPVSYEPLGVRFWLRGIDAPSYRQVVRKQIDQQITEGKAELSAKELETRHVERLAAATLSWENVTYHGSALECTPTNAQKVFREQIWIREQVAQFVEDRSHFLPV
ncbi:hypothetical protein A9Q83_13610 [Alphaproteobacteria bacterium 46_93_T64]|nr:hypothetical protein A9Q83_13610 [Alphaproteobacteria bacterium 46_93_T64]